MTSEAYGIPPPLGHDGFIGREVSGEPVLVDLVDLTKIARPAQNVFAKEIHLLAPRLPVRRSPHQQEVDVAAGVTVTTGRRPNRAAARACTCHEPISNRSLASSSLRTATRDSTEDQARWRRFPRWTSDGPTSDTVTRPWSTRSRENLTDTCFAGCAHQTMDPTTGHRFGRAGKHVRNRPVEGWHDSSLRS